MMGIVVALAASAAPARLLSDAAAGPPPSELVGVWRGTSVCTDRVAAPACHDEVVVYEFTDGAKAGSVHWKADKVVDGERGLMFELDLAYDQGDACWRAEFSSPRARGAWCLTVKGTRLEGLGWLLPGKQTVRRVDAHRER